MLLLEAFTTIFGQEVQFMLIFDSKDLYHAMCLELNSTYESVCQDFNCMRFISKP